MKIKFNVKEFNEKVKKVLAEDNRKTHSLKNLDKYMQELEKFTITELIYLGAIALDMERQCRMGDLNPENWD